MRSVIITLAAGVAAAAGILALGGADDEVVPQRAGGEVAVGEALVPAQVHVITRPGLYGLGPHPRGSSYAIVHSTLVRIDPAALVVQSIIRPAVQPLD